MNYKQIGSQTNFTTGPISTVNNGLKSLKQLGLKILDVLSPVILETLETLKNLRGKLSLELLKIVLVSYVLIAYITLGMSVSHFFWNQPFIGVLANRKSAYFGRESHDDCFCINLLFMTVFFYVFLIICF